jgi:putative peptidoglycan lipid II flippase
MLVLNVPATIGLVVLAKPVVSLLLERGQFGPDDTAATAAALACYAPGLVGYSAVKIASPSFYALRDARTPLFVSLAAVITNVVLNLTLVHVIGFRGLALGTAAAATLNAGVLLWILGGRLGGIEAARTSRTLVACLTASAVMGLAAWLVEWGLEILLPGTRTLVQAIRVFTAIAVGALTFAAIARALGVEEIDDLVRRVLKKPDMASHV